MLSSHDPPPAFCCPQVTIFTHLQKYDFLYLEASLGCLLTIIPDGDLQ